VRERRREEGGGGRSEQERLADQTSPLSLGTLVAVPRPLTYVERRTDGYAEPELVLLLAASHASATSAADADRVVREARPDAVVLELCRSRTGVLAEDGDGDEAPTKADNPFALSGSLARSVRLSGGNPAALLIRLLLARSAAKVAAGLGAGRPGADARAAASAASAVGATLVLGDRPIEITLSRAWRGMTWGQRCAVASSLGSGPPPGVDAASVDALRRDPASLAAVAESLTTAAPPLATALLHERDEWLAWSLARSRAVDGAGVVVGVLGAAHVRGVAFHLLRGADMRPRFKELAGVGEGGKKEMAAKVGVEVGIAVAFGVLLAAWGGWREGG